MDPNVALQNARMALVIFEGADSKSAEARVAAADLAEAFDAIDNWLTMGGFLPSAWTLDAQVIGK